MAIPVEPVKQALDGAIGVGAVTTPFWLSLESVAAVYIAIGGAVLITIRVAIAIRDWRRGKADK